MLKKCLLRDEINIRYIPKIFSDLLQKFLELSTYLTLFKVNEVSLEALHKRRKVNCIYTIAQINEQM